MKITDPNLPGVVYLKSAKCFRKNVWERDDKGNWHKTDEYITDSSGNYFWEVKTLVAGDDDTEEVEVTVPAKKNPVEGLNSMTPLKFEGLRVSLGVGNNNRKFWQFQADAVKGA